MNREIQVNHMVDIIPVIMAGGFSKRLHPLSNTIYPKQFLKITGEFSLLQQTLIRNKIFGKPVVVINEAHEEIALKQIQEVNIDVDLIIEPEAKNTAPATIIAALNYKFVENEILLFLPIDHYIEDASTYINTIYKALRYVDQYKLVMIGSKVISANTGYGYIKVKEQIDEKVYLTEKFTEKPDIITAIKYLNDVNYFWNSGIFLINCEFLLTEIQAQYPLLYLYIYESFILSYKTPNLLRIAAEPYSSITPISIDHALMEHTQNIILIEGNFGWQDLGSFDAIERIQQNLKPIQTLEYTNILNTNYGAFREDNCGNLKTFRVWGYYEILDFSELYKIKKLIIHPGAKLSLQYHNFRSEYWVIIQGSGEININHKIQIGGPNDSFNIPPNAVHQIKNIGQTDLWLIEIQTGSYIAEDDIIRLDP